MNIKKEEAFTLIEVLLTIVLTTLILGMLFNLNLSGWRFWKLNQDSVELSQLTTLISSNLDRRIRSYSISNIETNGSLKLGTIPDYEFYMKDNSLVLKNNGQERKIVNSNVKNVEFKKVDLNNKENANGPLIEYIIILEKNNKKLEISKTIKPRVD